MSCIEKKCQFTPFFDSLAKNLGLEMRIVSQFSQFSLDPIYIFFSDTTRGGSFTLISTVTHRRLAWWKPELGKARI